MLFDVVVASAAVVAATAAVATVVAKRSRLRNAVNCFILNF